MQHSSANKKKPKAIYSNECANYLKKIEKHKTTLPQCLAKALFKGNKWGEWKWETKETNLTRFGAGCT